MYLLEYLSIEFILNTAVNGYESAKLYLWKTRYPIEFSIACLTYLEWNNALAREYRMFGDVADAVIIAEIFQYLETNPEIIEKVREPEELK